jgi:putative transposase
MGKKPQV